MRGKTRSKHPRAPQQLFYSAIPQVVFRDMLPDEEAVRTVQLRCDSDSASSWALVSSVTVAKNDDLSHCVAELKLLGWALPIHASGATPAAAVHRAFDQLRVQACVMRELDVGTQIDVPHTIVMRPREVAEERSSNGECSSTQ